MRYFTLLAAACSLSLTSQLSAAQNYSSELHVYGGQTSLDGPFSDEKIRHAGIAGTYYFQGVNTRNHPLAEAAFLERASSISLSYGNSRWRFHDELYIDYPNGESEYLGSGRMTNDRSLASADVDFYIPNSIFYLGGSINEEKSRIRYRVTDGSQTFSGSYTERELSGNFWTFRAGLTPVNGLLVWSEFYEDQEMSDEWNLNAKYVFDWAGNALNLEASYDYFYGDDIINLAADFYFDRSFSLGVTFSDDSGDSANDTLGIRGRKFLTERLALEASFMTSDHADTFLAGLTARF